MADLLFTELLKLKRSKMLLLSLLGAGVGPFMVVLSTYLHIHTKEPDLIVPFSELFFKTNLYSSLLIGVPLYGVVTAYVFHREYAEDTMKNLLTIPVSRSGLLFSKMLLLLLWILLLTLVGWLLTLVLGWLAQFQGISSTLLGESLVQFMVTGLFLFILTTPMIVTTLVMKHYVPAMILSLVVTLINVMGSTSEYKGLIPWTAAFDIANGTLLPAYPAYYSYAVIGVTSIMGLAAALFYLRRADIE